jgi:hypothetical protein
LLRFVPRLARLLGTLIFSTNFRFRILGDLQHYWSGSFLAANAFIGVNMVGALLLGMLVGYERSYNGRAVGMRTCGLVCMASTALTVFVGHASLWYGGGTAHIEAETRPIPSRAWSPASASSAPGSS